MQTLCFRIKEGIIRQSFSPDSSPMWIVPVIFSGDFVSTW